MAITVSSHDKSYTVNPSASTKTISIDGKTHTVKCYPIKWMVEGGSAVAFSYIAQVGREVIKMEVFDGEVFPYRAVTAKRGWTAERVFNAVVAGRQLPAWGRRCRPVA
tara:strand:- start:44 stop:367 length:324 start_codon:yes stop_codon:yes gene_type:complete